ncbi:MAG: YceH family protein [Pseudomonadota bacterium]
MLTQLTEIEARVIGCLIEKSITTPDQYPLTLNALINACNQKSSREPVMALTQGEVERATRTLEERHIVTRQDSERSYSRVDKFAHRFCNTRYSQLQLDDGELALVCVLLLRGPQTPGELRTRCARLHAFEDNEAVVSSLTGLAEHDPDPLVIKLPRRAGRKDAEYTHLLCGPVDVEAYAAQAPVAPASERSSSRGAEMEDLRQRVATLEQEVARLKTLIGED